MFNVALAPVQGNSMVSSILMMVVFVAIFWFFIIRPQKKKEQQAKDMQNSIDVGDKITTIGGITGKVCSVKDDSIIIETSSDKTKLVFKKWAIGTVDSKKADKKKEEVKAETTVEEVQEVKTEE
ncbi:MAG: preprotein translocase subunit YajC [Eubacteriales bacterium]|nr:preprotein translocase subunit YajC [Eubacteriales bacterium]